MSFMAGFGDAFSRSFEAGNERNARRREDLFKMTYTDFINKRDKISEYKREDAKAARKAEALIEQSGVDPRAYPFVFKQVQAGVDESTLVNDLRTGRFEYGDDKESVETEAQPDTPEDVDPMAAQMENSGMVPPEGPAPVEATAPAADTSSSGINIGGLFPSFRGGTRAERDRARTFESVGSAAGISPEEVESTLSGDAYTPPQIDASGIKFTPAEAAQKADPISTLRESKIELDSAMASGDPKRIAVAERRWQSVLSASTIEAELKAKAEGIQVDGAPASLYKDGKYVRPIRVKKLPDGSMVDIITEEPVDGQVVPRDDAETDLLEKINASVGKPMEDQTARMAAATGSIRTYHKMADIVQKTNGEVLAPVTSGVFQWAEKWIQDATVSASRFNQLMAGGKVDEAMQTTTMESLQAQLEALQQNPDQSLGTQKGLFEVQKAIMAYQLGATMGQDGRSLAEAERKLFTEMAAGGVTPDRFHQGMSDILIGNVRSLDQQTKMILGNDMNVRQYIQDYQHSPEHINVEGLQSQLTNSTDPELKMAWDALVESDRSGGLKLPEAAPGAEVQSIDSQETAPGAPPVGTEQSGKGGAVYKFKGGNHKDPANWERIR